MLKMLSHHMPLQEQQHENAFYITHGRELRTCENVLGKFCLNALIISSFCSCP